VRLFYRPRTGRPLRVAWALEEVGAPYEAVAVADPDSPEHRWRSPLGRVPALELDDGRTLFDSTALVLQVADLFPDAGLIASPGTYERGLVYTWCLTAMTELERPAIAAIRGYGEATGAQQAFADGAGALAGTLDGREFLVADRFGVADIVVGGVLLVGIRAGLLSRSSPAGDALVDYLGALRARPSFARASARVESLFGPV